MQPGLVTFHGPMVAGDFARAGGVDEASWLAAVSSPKTYTREFSSAEVQILVPGTSEGVLYGGCLSLLCASLGTPYEIRTEGTILFIEDRAERPYRIDRMLMQLKLAGKFDGVRGIVFGEMIDCGEPGALDYTLQQVIMRILGDLNVPVVFGVEVRPRFQRGADPALRSACQTVGLRCIVTLELSTPRYRRRRSRRRLGQAVMTTETHSSDRHLRHCDGLAGGNAEAARASSHGVRRCGISPNVRLPGFAEHSGRAAVQRSQSAASSRPGGRRQCDLARQC